MVDFSSYSVHVLVVLLENMERKHVYICSNLVSTTGRTMGSKHSKETNNNHMHRSPRRRVLQWKHHQRGLGDVCRSHSKTMALHARDVDTRKDTCRSAIRSLAHELGRTPSEKEFKTYAASVPGVPTANQLRYVYGQWTDAVIDAGLEPLPTDPPRFAYSEAELIDEFIRVSNILGRLPSLELFRSTSQISNVPYRKWGKWSEVQRYFVSNFATRFSFNAVSASPKRKRSRETRLKYECALNFEPRNEFETIALFTILATDLGYRINSIRADFPDAVLEHNRVETLVEFEYLSSNYKAHCHPMSSEFMCICWRKDCDLGPVRIISLEDVLHEMNANQ